MNGRREVMARLLPVALASLGAAWRAGPARAQTQDGCLVVFGQGRNPSDTGASPWDRINEVFNTEIASTLESTGRRVFAFVAPANDADPAATAQQVLRESTRLRCNTIVESTVFADVDARLLVLRLRVYPVLPVVGGDAGITGFRIGPQIYVSQRDYPLSQAMLDSVRPRLLGAEMALEYAKHDRR
jgi:hypothetical protein